MAQVTITLPDGVTTRNIPCSTVLPNGKRNIDAKPNANIDGPVEVQTNAFENLKIVLQGVHYTGTTGDLTWADVKTLYTTKFTGSNAAKLNVIYGEDINFQGLEDSNDIYVTLESFSFPMKVEESKNAYLPVGTLTFIETDTA